MLRPAKTTNRHGWVWVYRTWILSFYCFLQGQPLRSTRRYRNVQVQVWLAKIPLPPLITDGAGLKGLRPTHALMRT